MEVREEDFLQWFAGFFDADGSIYWTGKINMNISQSEKTVLDKINDYYNGLFLERSKKVVNPGAKVNRTQFGLSKSGVALYPVLLDLEKYSIIKNPQIKLALEFLRYRDNNDEKSRQKREEIGKKIKLFNNDHVNQECINLRPYSENMSTSYIAGLFDGDGCVSIGTDIKKRYAKITQKNDPIILQKIKDIYPGSRYKEGADAVIFESHVVLYNFLYDILRSFNPGISL